MVQSSWELRMQNQLLRACITAPANCSSAVLGEEPGKQAGLRKLGSEGYN